MSFISYSLSLAHSTQYTLLMSPQPSDTLWYHFLSLMRILKTKDLPTLQIDVPTLSLKITSWIWGLVFSFHDSGLLLLKHLWNHTHHWETFMSLVNQRLDIFQLFPVTSFSFLTPGTIYCKILKLSSHTCRINRYTNSNIFQFHASLDCNSISRNKSRVCWWRFGDPWWRLPHGSLHVYFNRHDSESH